MGLCTSILGTVKFTPNPEAVKDLQKQLQTALDAVVPVQDEFADMPPLMNVRDIMAAVDLKPSCAEDKPVDKTDDKTDDKSVDKADDKLTNEIKDLDVVLNKLNRQIFADR